MQRKLFTPSNFDAKGIGDINTISNGPDNGANNVMACACWQPTRHGTTQQLIDNCIAKLNTGTNFNGINIGGHGSPGSFETGTGQTGPWRNETQVGWYNYSFWKPIIKGIENRNFAAISIYSCDTGEGQTGADFLFNLAKTVGRSARARTGDTIATSYSNGRCEISFAPGSDWQIAYPDQAPKAIHFDYFSYLIDFRNKEMIFFYKGEEAEIDPKKVKSISITSYDLIRQTERSISIEQNEVETVLTYLFGTIPFYDEGDILGYVTHKIEIFYEDDKLVYNLYNGKLLQDEAKRSLYYVNPLFLELLKIV